MSCQESEVSTEELEDDAQPSTSAQMPKTGKTAVRLILVGF